MTAALTLCAKPCEGVIVDYGCGYKPYRRLFPRATRYIGVDLGVRDLGDLELNPDGSIPLENESADGLLTTQVLEHVPDVQKYLLECVRILRPQGKLILSTHGIWPYHPGGTLYGDYHRWTPAGLCREIEEAGLQVTEVHKPCGGLLCLAQQFLALYQPGQSKNLFFNFFMVILSLLVNIPCAALNRLAPKIMNHGDIVPICIVVKAQKSL